MESLPAKTCTKCGEVKTLTDYHKKSANADGHQNFCKPCDNAARAKYRAENPEATTAYQLKYAEDNKDKELLRKRKYYEKNKELNREARNAYSREYAKSNPEKYNEYSHRRRVRKRNNGVLEYSTQEVLDTYGIDCHLCNRPIDLTAPRRAGSGVGWETGLHIDHVIPISKGGPDTLSNVRPSHAYCNISKRDRLMGEF
jgi:5-methylcytosine-specific restriction endonuclease McrA